MSLQLSKRHSLLFLLFLFTFTTSAQPFIDDEVHHSWVVFSRRSTDDPALRTLIFVDTASDALVEVDTYGERFTPAGDAIVYWDRQRQRVMQAFPDGSTHEHPLVQIENGAMRVDWVISGDGKISAWTQTFRDGGGSLSTVTRTAGVGDSETRVVLEDGPRSDGLRVMPVAFSSNQSKIYMDYQPDGLSALTLFPQYAGLFELDLNTGAVRFLPDEPGDFTGAGFGSGFFIRPALTTTSGFDLRVHNLDTQLDWQIPALNLNGFTQAGDVLIAPNGRYAVYALSQVSGFGSGQQTINTTFALVDLSEMDQEILTDSVTTFVRPVAWTEENTAVIFINPQVDGTWKLTLNEGELVKVADVSYIGVIE